MEELCFVKSIGRKTSKMESSWSVMSDKIRSDQTQSEFDGYNYEHNRRLKFLVTDETIMF